MASGIIPTLAALEEAKEKGALMRSYLVEETHA
jgi:hypothetical protein